MQFASAEEARDFCVSEGLHCHNGTDGVPFTMGNFFVADHPLTFNDLQAIPCRRDCGMTPAWKGILWVGQIRSPHSVIDIGVASIRGKCRVWGNILVAGDEDLMDRIEDLYRRK